MKYNIGDSRNIFSNAAGELEGTVIDELGKCINIRCKLNGCSTKTSGITLDDLTNLCEAINRIPFTGIGAGILNDPYTSTAMIELAFNVPFSYEYECIEFRDRPVSSIEIKEPMTFMLIPNSFHPAIQPDEDEYRIVETTIACVDRIDDTDGIFEFGLFRDTEWQPHSNKDNAEEAIDRWNKVLNWLQSDDKSYHFSYKNKNDNNYFYLNDKDGVLDDVTVDKCVRFKNNYHKMYSDYIDKHHKLQILTTSIAVDINYKTNEISFASINGIKNNITDVEDYMVKRKNTDEINAIFKELGINAKLYAHTKDNKASIYMYSFKDSDIKLSDNDDIHIFPLDRSIKIKCWE